MCLHQAGVNADEERHGLMTGCRDQWNRSIHRATARNQTTSPTLMGVDDSLWMTDPALEGMNRLLLSPAVG